MKFDIFDAKTQTYFAALMAVIYAVGQGSLTLPLGIPEHAVDLIKSWDNFIVGIWTISIPILMGMSKGAGPWATTTPAAKP